MVSHQSFEKQIKYMSRTYINDPSYKSNYILKVEKYQVIFHIEK